VTGNRCDAMRWPQTFDEIVRMTEAGITPPGIRVVEDRTSSSPVVLGASGDTPVRKVGRLVV